MCSKVYYIVHEHVKHSYIVEYSTKGSMAESGIGTPNKHQRCHTHLVGGILQWAATLFLK